ncbi:MAG: tetratricopeptide repeat protein [Pirellulaceae bacterium]
MISIHQDYLQDVMRLDIFGIRVGGEIDDPLIAPLRSAPADAESTPADKVVNASEVSGDSDADVQGVVPTLQPGKEYLLETVIRTMKMGHLFTQGTVDSNEIWLDVLVTSGDRTIGRSGGLSSDTKEVDPWSHFVNVFMLDQDGNRIERRNPEDIFTPLYNHQIPPGAAQTVLYQLTLPDDLDAPVRVDVKLQYRKFDQRYMDFVAKRNEELGQTIRGHRTGTPYVNELPITTLAEDTVIFPIEGQEQQVLQPVSTIPLWQRWNDYGIGHLLKGKAALRQAEEAFKRVAELDRWDGPMNLARVYNEEGRVDEAVEALTQAQTFADDEKFPRWTWAWLSGSINAQQGRLVEAVQNLTSVLQDSTAEMQARGFDFSLDYEVINLAGRTLFELGNQRARQQRDDEARKHWENAIDHFHRTLEIDPENVAAHYNLQLLYDRMDQPKLSEKHRELHQRYKPDDNAQGRAIRLAREKYPAANHAAEAIVRYPLHREGAPQ